MAARPICALATPAGRSAVAIIRLSGSGTLDNLEKMFVSRSERSLREQARSAVLGEFVNPADENQIIDEVLLIPFVAPHSYTGEEAAEIHTHGNPFIIQKIMQLLLANGFEAAAAGEFTRRAFLSGKLDLTEAEAVHLLVEARSERELQNALNLKQGSFRKRLMKFRSDLLNLTADSQAELDFIDEDITFVASEEKKAILRSLVAQCDELLQQAGQLNRFRHGVQVAIFGEPNTGKSTLLNYFAGSERAIVSDIPGTTRDFLECEMQLAGTRVVLVDTAGIRTTDGSDGQEKIEKVGIERSIARAQEADIGILLLDGSQMATAGIEHPELLNLALQFNHVLLVVNKEDQLHDSWHNDKAQREILKATGAKELRFVSAKTHSHLDGLAAALEAIVTTVHPHGEGILMAAWQLDLFGKLGDELRRALELVEAGELPELIVSSLQLALDLIAQITGEITSEDILGRIFSRFCIGK